MHVPNISNFIKQAQGVVTQNAPAILTGVGVVGVVGTAYLTAKGTIKAVDLVEEHRRNLDAGINAQVITEPTKLDIFKLTWLCYLPAVTAGVSTIGAIVYANRINAKRMAALLTAYTAADKAYNEYQEKVREHLTGPKEQKIRDEIAQDAVDVNPPTDGRQIHLTGLGDQLVLDKWTGRYFKSSVQALKQAENEVNATILKHDHVSLSEFYSQIGLDNTKSSDDLGWCVNHMVELVITATVHDDQAVLVMDFREDPFPDYYNVRSSVRAL